MWLLQCCSSVRTFSVVELKSLQFTVWCDHTWAAASRLNGDTLKLIWDVLNVFYTTSNCAVLNQCYKGQKRRMTPGWGKRKTWAYHSVHERQAEAMRSSVKLHREHFLSVLLFHVLFLPLSTSTGWTNKKRKTCSHQNKGMILKYPDRFCWICAVVNNTQTWFVFIKTRVSVAEVEHLANSDTLTWYESWF